MNDIDKIYKDLVYSYFVNDKSRLTFGGLFFILLFAIFMPFYLLFLKVKYIFAKGSR